MHIHATLKASLRTYGREIEHSRTILCENDLIRDESGSHLGAIFSHWRERRAVSPFDVPADTGFEPQLVVPGAVANLAIVDVSAEDPELFRAVHIGADALGMQGFRHESPEQLSPNGPHWALLLDMAWMKEDLRPVYVDTELAVDGILSRYVSMLLPVAGGDGLVTRIHVATRGLLLPEPPIMEAF